MLTNSRLLELRTVGLACQDKVAQGGGKSCVLGGPTDLERAYADLFQLVLDWPSLADAYADGDYRTKTSLAFLLGK